MNKNYENLYKFKNDLHQYNESLKYNNKQLNEENERLINQIVNLDGTIFELKYKNEELLGQINKKNLDTTEPNIKVSKDKDNSKVENTTEDTNKQTKCDVVYQCEKMQTYI